MKEALLSWAEVAGTPSGKGRPTKIIVSIDLCKYVTIKLF